MRPDLVPQRKPLSHDMVLRKASAFKSSFPEAPEMQLSQFAPGSNSRDRFDDSTQKSICVCICTFKRPQMLRKVLSSLERQTAIATATISVSIADNDASQSAKPTVDEFMTVSSIKASYACQPIQNIALARNTAVAGAHAEFIAFIDDDEFPNDDWLSVMLDACERFKVAGVLGPVRPHFEKAPPRWISDGGFFDRPEPPTGTTMKWEECRTGNVLLRSEILGARDSVFNPELGTGGEDKDFFRRMIAAGHEFRWCNEGAVYETVPQERWTRAYQFKRALLRGRNILKLRVGRSRLILTSLVAAPVYLVVMPFALALGQHVFMKYAIRFCDHAGRLMALVGINPVRER